MSDRRPEVVAWLAANGWKYRQAAKRFDVPYADAKAWGQAARKLPAAPVPAAPAPRGPSGTWANLERDGYLLRAIAEVAEDLDGARLKGSFIAIDKLRRLLDGFVAELAAWRVENNEKIDGGRTDAELLADLSMLLRDLPASHLEELLPVFEERLGRAVA